MFELAYERGSNTKEGIKVTIEEQSFEEAVAAFLEKSREQLDQETVDNLPSREAGAVQLPMPQPARPPSASYETFYRD